MWGIALCGNVNYSYSTTPNPYGQAPVYAWDSLCKPQSWFGRTRLDIDSSRWYRSYGIIPLAILSSRSRFRRWQCSDQTALISPVPYAQSMMRRRFSRRRRNAAGAWRKNAASCAAASSAERTTGGGGGISPGALLQRRRIML